MKSNEFFREVDEELQRDRLMVVWRRFGGLILGLATLVVLATAGWVGWRAWEQRQLNAEAERFAGIAAEAASAPAEAADKLAAFAAEAETGYRALARLDEAQARAAAGNEPGAVSALDTLAADAAVDPVLRDLAGILAASRELQTADPNALRLRLEPLAEGGRAFRHTARELLALLAMRTGDTEGAKKRLEELSRDNATPAALARRAGELLLALGGVEPKP